MTIKLDQVVHDFVKQWCTDHEYFLSEEMLTAYKKAGLPTPEGDKGWRDKWGGVITRSQRAGFIKKVGKAAPASRATHMSSTALWMSMLYQGERTVIETGASRIDELRMLWVDKKITNLRQLLWEAYEFGYDQGASKKAKLNI